MMMSAIGYGGLVVDGAELRFEYRYVVCIAFWIYFDNNNL